MSASRKSGYYWVKYVNQSHWSIEYWNGGMWFTRNSHLVEDSMFSTIDETPIVREQKETEQQSNCNLPHVSSSLRERELNKYLEEINTLMWNTWGVKHNKFDKEEGSKIMSILNRWASNDC